MVRPLGRPTNRAARIDKGTIVFTVKTTKNHTEAVKVALTRAMRKLSGSFKMVIK